MTEKLEGKKVAILAADMFERVELEEPRKALEDAGAETEVVSIHDGEIQGFDHFDPANTVKVDKTVEEVTPDDYDALLIPGGVGNPDQLRGDENAVAFVRDFHEAGKPIAAICHGPWVLVEAGVVRGKRLTSWPTLETDIRNAGGEWVDEEVVVDDNLVTSRKPDDIPAFNEKMLELFSGHAGRFIAARPATREGGGRDSNPRPPGPQPGALPTELPPPRPHRVPGPEARATLGRLGPVAQWTERQPSKLRAEVQLLPGPSPTAAVRPVFVSSRRAWDTAGAR